MNDDLKTKIVETLAYFDIFNYPLNLTQLRLFLHNKNSSNRAILNALAEIEIIEKKYGYYFFKGREKIAVRRKIQLNINKEKRKAAIHSIYLISKIPGVKLVGISGSLAMGNASQKDDIDLFIITRRNTLWITRFLVVFLMKILKQKREVSSKNVDNKICLNMFLDEDSLELDKKNLYVAHEVIQMQTYFDKGEILNKFLNANSWIQSYFPNLIVKSSSKELLFKEKAYINEKIIRFINAIFFLGQYLYMQNKITYEKVFLKKALFHPWNKSEEILNEFERRKMHFINHLQNSEKSNELSTNNLNIRLKNYN